MNDRLKALTSLGPAVLLEQPEHEPRAGDRPALGVQRLDAGRPPAFEHQADLFGELAGGRTATPASGRDEPNSA